MKKTKKIFISVLAIIIAVIMLLFAAMPLFYARAETVSSLQSKLEQAQKDKKDAQSRLSSIQGNISDITSQKALVDEQIASVEDEIYILRQSIETNQAKIHEKEQEIADAEAKIAEYDGIYKTRIRLFYEQGTISYLDVIFGAESFSDLLYRIELLDEISEYDQGILKIMTDAKNVIVAARDEIQAQQDQLLLNKEIQDSKMAELEANRSAKLTLISALEADEASYKKILDQADAAESSIRSQIQAMTGSGTVTYSGGALQWPTPSTTYITSEYGTRFHPIQKRYKTHTGIDIGAGYGASIVAAEGGTVLAAGWNAGGYGKYVVIDHGGGLQTLYGHCSALNVSAGQQVSRGQKIAEVGSTGNSTGPHLHFEVLNYGQHTNPMSYF